MNTPVRGELVINNTNIVTFLVELGPANLILAVAPRGFLMCGYLDISVAEKLQNTACVVSGVQTVDELLSKPVVKLTSRAQQLGITAGISGRAALEKMI